MNAFISCCLTEETHRLLKYLWTFIQSDNLSDLYIYRTCDIKHEVHCPCVLSMIIQRQAVSHLAAILPRCQMWGYRTLSSAKSPSICITPRFSIHISTLYPNATLDAISEPWWRGKCCFELCAKKKGMRIELPRAKWLSTSSVSKSKVLR